MANNKNNKKPDVSEVKPGEIEIISPENSNKEKSQIIVQSSNNDNVVNIDRDGIQVKESGNLVIGSLNLILNPLKKRWKRDYSGNIWHLVADAFLLLIIIGLIIFIFITNNWTTSRLVSLNISSNNEGLSGAITSFELDYKSNKEVSNASVQIMLPENFILESVSPNNFYNKDFQVFDLGELEKNSSGKIKINGLVWGNPGDQQNITFIFNCSKCGRSGIPTSMSYNIDKVALENHLELDDIIYINSDFTGKIKLKNNTNKKIDNIKISLGEDINIEKSNFSLEKNKIIINKIEGGEELEISFLAHPKKEDTLLLKPEFEISLLNNTLSFLGEEKKVEIKNPGLGIKLSRGSESVKENDWLSYVLNYNNQEAETVKNVKISVSSANPNFSIASLNISDYSQGTKLSGNTIIIDDLIKDESGKLNLEVLFDRRQNISNQELFLKVNLEYEIDSQIVEYTTYSNKNKVVTRTMASASAYYYSPQGDQLGVGPLPPAVDMTTNYWVFLEFSSLGNNLENLSLTAELPQNVYFSNNKRVLDGSLIYGEIGKRIIWEIERVNGNNTKYRANFEITLIPDEGDLGRVVNLLENIKITAYDNFTGQEINQNLPNISSNLINDKLSSGNGVVRIIR
jgi:hypothetical protein